MGRKQIREEYKAKRINVTLSPRAAARVRKERNASGWINSVIEEKIEVEKLTKRQPKKRPVAPEGQSWVYDWGKEIFSIIPLGREAMGHCLEIGPGELPPWEQIKTWLREAIQDPMGNAHDDEAEILLAAAEEYHTVVSA